ncbi:MAG: alpha/beta family hydrolase [Actinomycetota bacterium]
MPPEQRIAIETARGPVTGAWEEPKDAAETLVVAPGAGSGFDAPILVGFTRALVTQGIAALRFNFPYREQGRKSPDPEPTLIDAWNAAFAWAEAQRAGPAFAGGKSLGGRMASMAAGEGMPVAGLVFLGYPLHPPGKPERVRDEHLYGIEAPMLFLQGTADPFAKWDLVEKVVKKLGKRAELHPIEGGDHSFRVKGAKRDDREIGESLATPAAEFMRAHSA